MHFNAEFSIFFLKIFSILRKILMCLFEFLFQSIHLVVDRSLNIYYEILYRKLKLVDVSMLLLRLDQINS